MSAGKAKGADSFGAATTARQVTPPVTKPAASEPAAPLLPLEPAVPATTTPTTKKPTGKQLRAAIEKSNKELADAPAVVTTYGAERRKNGTSGLWGETDVTERVLANGAQKR